MTALMIVMVVALMTTMMMIALMTLMLMMVMVVMTAWKERHLPQRGESKHAREEALKASLNSGRYPTFQGVEGPTNDLDPTTSSVFEYLEIVWPNSLCELMALETNRYAVQKGVSNWENTTITEMWMYWASYY